MLMNFHIPHSHITAALLLIACGNHSVFATDEISSGLSAKSDATTRPTKPNILIMMADDMGIGDTSAYLKCAAISRKPSYHKNITHTEPEAIHKISDCVHRRLCTSLYVQCNALLSTHWSFRPSVIS